jgi:pyruvate-ferredoxin/flavodoxin oxidoreductase
MQTTTIDGNTSTSLIAYSLSDVACIYPITPSSPMAEHIDEWQASGKLNIFGNKVKVTEMQSEAGVAGALHGLLKSGTLATTFTSSQGLLLMIPNMYKIAGELLPCVFHVSARTVATHALNIFCDHSDVMACRDTGFAMLCSSSVQETNDLALISHISSLKSSIPFIHFFDGFRTSHEIQKIDILTDDEIKKLVPYNDIKKFRDRALTPTSPTQSGTAQNPDVFFQNREASNIYYNNLANIVKDSMNELYKITKRKYNLFDYYGDKKANSIIVIMGSASETVKETIDYLNKVDKENKYGVIVIRLFRPFIVNDFIEQLPKTTKIITTLDRVKVSTSIGEPIYEDVISSLSEKNKKIKVIGGRYGLGGKDFSPKDVKAVFDNSINEQKNHFSVGIIDDITNSSLNVDDNFSLINDGYEAKFYGLGSDGTVSANKNSIKIIAENTNKFCQGYFEYDSKKSGSLTISHLRTSDRPIRSTYLVQNPNFVACHNYSFIFKYDILKGIKENGSFLLNFPFEKSLINKLLPENIKKTIKEKHLKFFIIDAEDIALKAGLKNKINTVMQTAYFVVSKVIDIDKSIKFMKDAIISTYSKKGQDIVDCNFKAIDNSLSSIKEINTNELTVNDTLLKEQNISYNEYYNNFIKPISLLNGNNLPVSKFSYDGTVPTSTTKFEKRGIGIFAPVWNGENCIQCNLCAISCPHACLRPIIQNKETLKNAPKSFITFPVLNNKDLGFRLQVDVKDCTGCGICANVCPAKNKALTMQKIENIDENEYKNYEFYEKLPKNINIYPENTIKGVGFKKPLFEFSGACAGCGETPYIKLLTTMFGDRMIIANATGCSSIYGGSCPTCPYTKNEDGYGPSWCNSLFEDNAEFGYGIYLGYKARKENFDSYIKNNNSLFSKSIQNLLISYPNETDYSKQILIKNELLKNLDNKNSYDNYLKENIDLILKKSVWAIGGDGWAYDIGFGGLDHIMASNENIKVLVLDTEVYSNTGGQSSKSSPKGSVCKFAINGKETKKKNLAEIAMTYKNVYVAQISLGANPQQAINAFKEAEEYNGVSIVIAYCPCINHGIDMSKSNEEMKNAVNSGYFNLFRYNPSKDVPLIIDSKLDTTNYVDFLMNENRYKSLYVKDKDKATKLFESAKNDAENRANDLKSINNNNNNNNNNNK